MVAVYLYGNKLPYLNRSDMFPGEDGSEGRFAYYGMPSVGSKCDKDADSLIMICTDTFVWRIVTACGGFLLEACTYIYSKICYTSPGNKVRIGSTKAACFGHVEIV